MASCVRPRVELICARIKSLFANIEPYGFEGPAPSQGIAARSAYGVALWFRRDYRHECRCVQGQGRMLVHDDPAPAGFAQAVRHAQGHVVRLAVLPFAIEMLDGGRE